MVTISEIEGIGETYAAKLRAAGISTVEALLEKGGDPKGRQDLETKTGIGHRLILRWVNHADLFRIKGVGKQYAELLEAAGVDTVVELATRNAENLYAAMVKTNEAKKLVRALPTQADAANWIAQAKGAERKVHH
jgi:predicted flap endonuclease-1-like 5' DNA nuclease